MEADRETCNRLNSEESFDNITTVKMLDDEGGVLHPQGTRTPKLYFYEDSKLRIEWTHSHGCGNDPRGAQCNIVLQYACEDTLEDDCGLPDSGQTCGPRDGRPITNHDVNDRGDAIYKDFFSGGNIGINRRQRDREATATIPTSTTHNAQADLRFGRHESLRYYEKCYRRERNKGLWTGDLWVGDRATSTRQDGGRFGLECQEEADYYPYWAPTPWKDIAILTHRTQDCGMYVGNSQNQNKRYECVCPTCASSNQLVPNNAGACATKGGKWTEVASHNIPPPHCGAPPTSQENELVMFWYDWVVPKAGPKTQSCTIRIRYNITTQDGMLENDGVPVTVFGTAAQNNLNTPVHDRSGAEADAYFPIDPNNNRTKLGLAVNTQHYGRTFQDRSYVFTIKPRSLVGECASKTVHNLNSRGKRGNIVQTFPAVEYDFTPNELFVDNLFSCVHVQWTGSDYNPARNDNNAYGGTPDPNDLNNGRADRHNMVQMYGVMEYQAVVSLDYDWNMFTTSRQRKVSLAFIDQPITNTEECMTIESILALSALADNDQNNPKYTDNGNNYLNQNNDRDRYYKNCGKLSGAKTPYFDGGLFLPGPPGRYGYISTRGNSFSNRNEVGIINVSSGFVTSGLISVVLLAGLGLTGLGAVFMMRRRSKKQAMEAAAEGGSGGPAKVASETLAGAFAAVIPGGRLRPNAVAANGGGGAGAVTALYDHVPSEAGELAFKRGDVITVLSREDAGWWEGRTPNGARGIFPSNYVA